LRVAVSLRQGVGGPGLLLLRHLVSLLSARLRDGVIHKARQIGRVMITQPSRSRLPAASKVIIRRRTLTPGPPPLEIISYNTTWEWWVRYDSSR
jgi:hypothetical protein